MRGAMPRPRLRDIGLLVSRCGWRAPTLQYRRRIRAVTIHRREAYRIAAEGAPPPTAEPIPSDTWRPSITVCPKCRVDFGSRRAMRGHARECQVGSPYYAAPALPPEPPPSPPLNTMRVNRGQCPKCGEII